MYFSVFIHNVLYMCHSASLVNSLLKIIDSVKQLVLVSSYKHTDPSQPHILRIIQLQQSDQRFRYPVYFLHTFLQLDSWLCVGVLWEMMLFCVRYMWIYIVMCLMIMKLKFRW